MPVQYLKCQEMSLNIFEFIGGALSPQFDNQLPQIVVAGQMIVWHQCLERDRINWFMITKLRHYHNIDRVRLAPVVVEHH